MGGGSPPSPVGFRKGEDDIHPSSVRDAGATSADYTEAFISAGISEGRHGLRGARLLRRASPWVDVQAGGTTHDERAVEHPTSDGVLDVSFGAVGTGFADIQVGQGGMAAGIVFDAAGRIVA